MITKQDCLLLLSDLSDLGIDTEKEFNDVLKNGVSIQAIKFINSNRQLDLSKFYEKVRHSYNDKKSKLYINIVKDLDEKEPDKVITTLSALSTQILLYSKTVSDKKMFLNHSRLSEILQVLYKYSQTLDIVPCIKLLRLIKADLKCLEN